MGVLYLSVELAFDLVVLIIGCILILQAKDNYQKLYWGVIATCIGALFLWENIGWLLIVSDTPTYQFTELLNIEKMLKWYALASIVALFPIASLCPGYLNHLRLIVFLLPPIITITVGVCYLCFNGHITPVYSLEQIISNLDKPDVKLRLTIFLITIIAPLLFAVYPIVRNKAYRRINNNMYLFIGFMALFVAIYILFTLSINEFIFNLFGITSLTFTFLFSTLYLFHENPFSNHIKMIPDETSGHTSASPAELPCPLPLFLKIESYMADQHPYTNNKFKINDLADSLQESTSSISQAIKSGGFTGFREYINYLRMEYFKQLAMQNQDKNIKELMFQCGFISRSTFYRNFTEKYGISPLKYIDNQSIK